MSEDPCLFELTSESGFTFRSSAIRPGLTMGKQASFNKTAIMNRSSSIVTYSHSENDDLSISIHLVATKNTKTQVSEIVNCFKSLTHPMVPGIAPPPKCVITLGNGEIIDERDYVCTSYNFAPGETYSNEGNFMLGIVSLSFMEIEMDSTSSKEWGSGGYSQLAWDIK